jgi:hypothetical protein
VPVSQADRDRDQRAKLRDAREIARTLFRKDFWLRFFNGVVYNALSPVCDSIDWLAFGAETALNAVE